jgi:tetratricopeptide (TPR) repeat protein
LKLQIEDALRSLDYPLDAGAAATADWAVCRNDNAQVDVLIEACGRIISYPLPGYGFDYLPYYSRGLAYLEKKNYNDAIEDFPQAIKRVPNANYIYFVRAQAHERAGEYSPAMADYEKVLSIEISTVGDEQWRKTMEAMRKEAKERFDHLAAQGYIVPPRRPF